MQSKVFLKSIKQAKVSFFSMRSSKCKYMVLAAPAVWKPFFSSLCALLNSSQLQTLEIFFGNKGLQGKYVCVWVWVWVCVGVGVMGGMCAYTYQSNQNTSTFSEPASNKILTVQLEQKKWNETGLQVLVIVPILADCSWFQRAYSPYVAFTTLVSVTMP